MNTDRRDNTDAPLVSLNLELVSVDRDKDRVHYKSELIDPPAPSTSSSHPSDLRPRLHNRASRVGLTITEEHFDRLGRPVEVWLNIVDAAE